MSMLCRPSTSDLRGWELLEEIGNGRSSAVYKTRKVVGTTTTTTFISSIPPSRDDDMDVNARLWKNDDGEEIIHDTMIAHNQHQVGSPRSSVTGGANKMNHRRRCRRQAPHDLLTVHERDNTITTPSSSSASYVIKVVPFYRSQRSQKPTPHVMQRFAIEQKMCAWSGMIGLGPRLISTWTTSRWGFIVMEQWDMTLAEWKRMHRIHSSFHTGNNESVVDILPDLSSTIVDGDENENGISASDGDLVSKFVDYSIPDHAAIHHRRRRTIGDPTALNADNDNNVDHDLVSSGYGTEHLKAQIASTGLLCASNTIPKAVQTIVSVAKWAGHRDIKDSNIVVKLDRNNSNHIAQVGIIDWDKVVIRPHLLKQIMNVI